MDFNGKDVLVEVKVSFKEALHGTEKNVTFKKEIKCKSCNGSKEERGSKSS